MRVRIDGDRVEVPFQVQREQAGLRLDAFLTARLRRYSRTEVHRLIENGKVVRPGRVVKPSGRVVQGEMIFIRYERCDEPPARYDALPIVYEDEWLAIINKPGDLISHPTDRVVRNSATSILREQFGGSSLHLAHRLDRETSGALIFAKTPAAARALMSQFLRRAVEKDYLAIVAGEAAFSRRIVDAPLGFQNGEIIVRQAIAVPGAAPAATEFESVSASKTASLLLARPKTGRLHQIRVHLASIGHPVLGDKLYYGDGAAYLKAVRRELASADLEALGAPRQMLHAWKIGFDHPATGRPLRVTAPLPPDFTACLERYGLRVQD